ncbi:nucleotide exchange factor GrpE [Peptococcaceae bacterium]|nr:nucleotide exchange factor GrpE [Peptococcaceae bacterium]
MKEDVTREVNIEMSEDKNNKVEMDEISKDDKNNASANEKSKSFKESSDDAPKGEGLTVEGETEKDESSKENTEIEGKVNNEEKVCNDKDNLENLTKQVGDLKKQVEDLKNQLTEKEALAKEYYNRLARAQADFENLRRRTNKEREQLLKYAAEELIIDILPVIDNFQRALESKNKSSEEFVSGVEMIYKQLLDVLKKAGVEEIKSLGEDFDPNKHEAIMQVESEEYPENKIVEVLRKGYILKDKIIRPAMVKVSK